MAVLVEGISLVVRLEALQEKIPGGWEAFRSSVPNSTLCADGEVARVGFMSPADVEAFVRVRTEIHEERAKRRMRSMREAA